MIELKGLYSEREIPTHHLDPPVNEVKDESLITDGVLCNLWVDKTRGYSK